MLSLLINALEFPYLTLVIFLLQALVFLLILLVFPLIVDPFQTLRSYFPRFESGTPAHQFLSGLPLSGISAIAFELRVEIFVLLLVLFLG